MKCKDAEKRLLRSFDGELEGATKADLDSHLKVCPGCLEKQSEYKVLLQNLKIKDVEPLAYFWERLETKLRERERVEPWTIWARWSRRSVPVALALILLFIGGLALFAPGEEDLSQSEALLLRNDNPLAETKTFFEETRLENKNMMIIFTVDEKVPARR
jgi:predicted anti-sigma-YlaC factor YlaD